MKNMNMVLDNSPQNVIIFFSLRKKTMKKRMLYLLSALVVCAGCVSYHTPPEDRRVTVSPDLGTCVWVTDV